MTTPTVLITGASRGIGLELVRQYALKSWRVIATARAPVDASDLQTLARTHANILIEPLDVADHAAIDALAAKLRGTAIDVLINNAGILGGGRDRQRLGALEYDMIEQVHRTNTIGPIKMAEAFVEHVAASQQKKIVVITSGTASLTNVKPGPMFTALYAYRMSKTAVNMAMRLLAAELAPRGIYVGILGPGMVETRVLWDGGFKGLGISPEQSVAGVIRNIENLKAATSGQAILHDGSIIPW